MKRLGLSMGFYRVLHAPHLLAVRAGLRLSLLGARRRYVKCSQEWVKRACMEACALINREPCCSTFTICPPLRVMLCGRGRRDCFLSRYSAHPHLTPQAAVEPFFHYSYRSTTESWSKDQCIFCESVGVRLPASLQTFKFMSPPPPRPLLLET